jgi:hypothetical protein
MVPGQGIIKIGYQNTLKNIDSLRIKYYYYFEEALK